MTEPVVHPNLGLCSICGGDAQFTDKDPGAYPVSYCAGDLPQHLRERAAAGQLTLVTDETKTRLLEQARDLEIEGRTTMDKEQLEAAVAAAHASKLNAEQVVEVTTMSDAPESEQVVVQDHAVEAEADEPRKTPRRSTKK